MIICKERDSMNKKFIKRALALITATAMTFGLATGTWAVEKEKDMLPDLEEADLFNRSDEESEGTDEESMNSLIEELGTSSDPVYVIRSAVDQNYVLDNTGASIMNSSKIQLYMGNSTEAQMFEFHKFDDGTYQITNYVCGKALDVYGGYTTNGTQIQLYDCNNTDAQRWKIQDNSDGTKSFINVSSGKALDVYGGVATNGAKIQLFTSNGSTAQKFYLQEVTPTYQKTYEGTSVVRTAVKNTSVLDVYGGSKNSGANVTIYAANATPAQRFDFIYSGNGYYKIINVNSGKALDLSGGIASNTRNVQQYEWNGSNAQLWQVVSNGDGTVSIRSKVNNDYVLDVAGGVTANFTNVWLYKYNGSSAQKWILESMTEPSWEKVFFAPYESGASEKAGNGVDAYGVDRYGNFACGWFQATIKKYKEDGEDKYTDYDVKQTINTIYNYNPGMFSELSPYRTMDKSQLYNNSSLKTIWHKYASLYRNEFFLAQQLEVESAYLQPALTMFKNNGLDMTRFGDTVQGVIASCMVRWGNTKIYSDNISAIKAACDTGSVVNVINALYDARIAYDKTINNETDIKRCTGERACALAIAQGKLDAKTWVRTKLPLAYNEAD